MRTWCMYIFCSTYGKNAFWLPYLGYAVRAVHTRCVRGAYAVRAVHTRCVRGARGAYAVRHRGTLAPPLEKAFWWMLQQLRGGGVSRPPKKKYYWVGTSRTPLKVLKIKPGSVIHQYVFIVFVVATISYRTLPAGSL